MSVGIEEGLVTTSEAQVAVRGLVGLAYLTDADFERQVTMLKSALDRIEQIKEAVLEEGIDFDVIPGTNKPTLLQPGAQKLCLIGRMAPSYEITRTIGDGVAVPHVHYLVKCSLHLANTAGPTIAEGVGSASTWEKKYRYRKGSRICPDCGHSDTVIKGKAEYGGGWLCFAKKGGCGAKFKDDDGRITGQTVRDVANEDPVDLDNTCLKMAKKRALNDTVLFATASSGSFSTDIEDSEDARRLGIVSDEDQKAARERVHNLEEFARIVRASGAKKMREVWQAASLILGKPIVTIKEFENLTLDEAVKLVEQGKEKFKPVAS